MAKGMRHLVIVPMFTGYIFTNFITNTIGIFFWIIHFIVAYSLHLQLKNFCLMYSS